MKEWSSATKCLRQRGIVANTNPLQNNLDTPSIDMRETPTHSANVTDITIPSSVPSLPTDETSTEYHEETDHITA